MPNAFWRSWFSAALLLLLLVLAPVALAGTGEWKGSRVPAGARAVAAVAATEASAVRLDGDLDEGAWAKAPIIADFVQREPNEGKAPSFRTEARVVYDHSALFVAIRAYDPEPGKIVGLLTRRDTDSPSDWLGIVIDSYHDRRTAYEFDVNAAGVKADKYRFNDINQDPSWDAVWDARTVRGADGWTAYFRIPFSQLRFDPTRANTFGFAVTRRIGRLNETSTWPLLPRSAPGYVSSLGELTGLNLQGGRKRLELAPYTVGQVETQSVQAGNPFVRSTDATASVGADAKFAVTPGLTATATLNPDFGQVEADPAVVNLSAFETYFDERRPFFVEGSGIFHFDIDCNDGQCRGLFYSRRIGRTPRGAPPVPDGGFASIPAQTTIIGAAKLTGRVGKFSVGGLNAVTSDERASVFDGTATTRTLVEPLTSYSVGRATREFANQSSLGFMATATNRRLTDAVSFLPSDAYTGGMDWDWRMGKKGAYSLSGFWAASTVRGSTEALTDLQESMVHAYQRPDAGHVALDEHRTSLNGMSAQAGFSKIAGDKVRFMSNGWLKTPGFDINDLGFLTRADERGVSNWLQIRNDKPTKHFRNTRLNFNQWTLYNFDGDRLALGANVNGHVLTQGNNGLGGGVNVEAEAFDDRLTRGGPGGRTTRWLYGWTYFESDDRKPVQYNHFLQGGRDRHGSWRLSFGPAVTLRPSAAVSMTLGMNVSRNVDDSQWVENVAHGAAVVAQGSAVVAQGSAVVAQGSAVVAQGSALAKPQHYVFGHLDQTTVAATVRVNYTLTPRLSIQLYVAPFVSAGAYSRFKELVNGRAAAYQDRYAPYPYAGNPDFNYRSFRTTNVLRWEYRPGSTLFVVWQQGREQTIDSGRFSFGRDFRDAFRAAGHNVFLVKIAHWLNF